jgi:tetratricopeptide (TPR) repeat protein
MILRSHRISLERCGARRGCRHAPPARLAIMVRIAAAGLCLPMAGPLLAQEAAADGRPADGAAADGAAASEPPARLIDRPAFDRVTLDERSGGVPIDVQPLALPDGRVPDPLPTAGALKLFRVNEPSVEYEVAWSDVAKIERFPDLVLAEARLAMAAAKWSDAFDGLSFLHRYYPEQPGLNAASQEYLWRDAGATFSSGKPEESLPALIALYELNPAFPRLPNAVQVLADSIVTRLLKEERYAAARAALDSLERTFPNLTLAGVQRWRARFAADATTQLAAAREAFAAGDFAAARSSAQRADAILPGVAGVGQLLAAIQRAAPEMRVGVLSLNAPDATGRLPAWEKVRDEALANPCLVDLVDFGAEGGIYRSRWGVCTTRDDGLETTLELSPAAVAQGVTPASVALRLLHRADPTRGDFDADFASLLAGVELAEGRVVVVRWRRPHVSPQALLHIPLADADPAATGRLAAFARTRVDENGRGNPPTVVYRRTRRAKEAPEVPQTVVERLFDDDQAALSALAQGEIDVLDHLPPWLLETARQTPGVRVLAYRLPTVHALAPNPHRPLLQQREFRRALCYALDLEGIVRDMLLAGQPLPGFQPLSGPFPAGVALGDPAGYAYDVALAPRTYSPRLAAVLAGVARSAGEKPEPSETDAAPSPAGSDAPPSPTGNDADQRQADPPQAPAPSPLTLAHSTDPVARLACQSLKRQLDGAGIPVQLVEIAANNVARAQECDLAYVELAIWEPVVDARRLLGPRGAAGSSTAFMGMALDQLSRSQNWNDARNQLKEIHRIARADLPVIPLWQTVNHLAVREWLQGVAEQPVSLYQDVDAWRKRFDDAQ